MATLQYRTISNRTVPTLEPGRGDTIYWDRNLRGFGVRVYASGTRVYVAQARGPGGSRRVALGRHGVVGAEQARREATMVIARIKAGLDPTPARTAARRPGGATVAAVAKKYMEEFVAVRCKPGTVRVRGKVIRRHIVPALGRRALASVGSGDVIGLHQRLAATPASANHTIDTLAQIFKQAELWGLVPEGTNPCRSVTRYRTGSRERFLTHAEFERVGRILDEAPVAGGVSPAAVAGIRLLMFTGCRSGEIVSLRWEDVHLAARELRLRDSKTGPRTVPLSPSAVAVLEGLKRSPHHDWVIPSRHRGKPLRGLGSAWHVVRARANLPDVRLHDLRHSFASRALAMGESLPMIAKLLGHRQLKSTARYAHLARDSVHEAASRVADSIAGDIL